MDSKDEVKKEISKKKKKKKTSFKCLFCDKKFPKKFNWQRHCQNVHDITVAVSDKDKPIKCNVCDKSYSERRALYEHCRKKHISLLDHLDVPVKGKRNRNKSLDGTVTPKKEKEVTLADEAVVMDHLPREYTYKVIKFNRIDVNKFHFKVKFYVNELSEVTSFIENYAVKNCIRFRLGKVLKGVDDVTVFHKHYCCHRNAQKKHDKNRKNTNCPGSATMIVKKLKVEEGDDRLSCSFRVNYNHNHPFDESEVKYLLPNSKVADRFKEMFLTGLPPFKAFKTYKEELQAEYGDKFPEISKNRSICPNQTWVYNCYYKVVKELDMKPPLKIELGEPDEEEGVVEYLEEEFENENEDLENMEVEYLEEEFEEETDGNEIEELEEFLLLHGLRSEDKSKENEADQEKLIIDDFEEKCLFDMINRVSKKFSFYKDAVKAFCESYKNLKSDDELVKAMRNFGKVR